jgi:DNA-binding XRE family transcriptional regulator
MLCLSKNSKVWSLAMGKGYPQIQQDIGIRIKELREKKHHTQESLALRSNLDRTYINSVENGRKNISVQALDLISTQQYSCVMIPGFVDIGGPLRVLPPGVHNASLNEVEDRFATSEHRKHLFIGFKNGIENLKKAGCRRVFLDGSFITEKPVPNDFDVCWDSTGVDVKKLDPVFLDFTDMRRKQKKRFYGEFFPASFLADSKHFFLDFFQVDKYTGNAKGIICIQFPKV